MEVHFLENNFETVGSKPVGLKGLIAGKIMNLIHSGFYRKIINEIIIPNKSNLAEITVLDIGCGGGTGIKSFANNSSVKKVYGIDYSEDMVKLSRKLNQKKLNIGSVEIKVADVSKLPFANDSFDIITAFDTINFWPDQTMAISEILRTMKQGGSFFIINAFPKEGTKWFDFVKYKSEKEYYKVLSSNGFSNVSYIFQNNTIIVQGIKL
jgi:ubiquinone/menaquinone biosynthesis C-methylase UbiE